MIVNAGYIRGQAKRGSNAGGGRLHILLYHGQSNDVGATGDGDATGALTVIPPDIYRLLMFNGGITPLQATPSSVSKTVVIDAGQLASIEPAREGANPFVNRETWSLSAAQAFARALPARDKVVLINCGLGSCDFNDLIVGFTGSRATFSGSISGTEMTVTAVTVTAGTGLTNGLIINHASITPGTVITVAPPPPEDGAESGGPGVYTISPSQTVASFTGATTTDPSPQPWANMVTAITAAVTWATVRGMTPVIPAFLFDQGESDQTLALVAQRYNQLVTLRTQVNSLKSITGQTSPILILHPQVASPIFNINWAPASNANNDTPDDSLMQKVSPVTLAAHDAALGIADFATVAAYWASSGSTTVASNRVHRDRTGHQQMGWLAGTIAATWLAGGSVVHPYVVACTGNLGSTTRVIQLSESAVIDTSIVSDPGQRGVNYYDDAGEVAITNVAVSGTTVTLTMATAPSGISERVEIACSNGTVLGTYTGTEWPFTAPPVCMGPNFGMRSQLRAVRDAGTRPDTGEALPRFFIHQRRPSLITSDSATVAGMFDDLGVTPSLIIDASDSACYPGTGQSITDVSPGATSWQLGIDGSATATDPSFVAASGSQPAYFDFFAAGKSITPTSALTLADDWHKAGASFVVFATFFLPSAPPYATAQTMLSTCTDATSGIGVQIRVSTSGRWQAVLQNGVGFPLNASSTGTGIVTAGWNVCAVGVDGATNTAWIMMPVLMATTGPQVSTISINSPSAAAANGVVRPVIGKTAITADVNAKHLLAGSRVQMIASCAYQPAAKMVPLYASLAARVGLTVNPI